MYYTSNIINFLIYNGARYDLKNKQNEMMCKNALTKSIVNEQGKKNNKVKKSNKVV